MFVARGSPNQLETRPLLQGLRAPAGARVSGRASPSSRRTEKIKKAISSLGWTVSWCVRVCATDDLCRRCSCLRVEAHSGAQPPRARQVGWGISTGRKLKNIEAKCLRPHVISPRGSRPKIGCRRADVWERAQTAPPHRIDRRWLLQFQSLTIALGSLPARLKMARAINFACRSSPRLLASSRTRSRLSRAGGRPSGQQQQQQDGELAGGELNTRLVSQSDALRQAKMGRSLRGSRPVECAAECVKPSEA